MMDLTVNASQTVAFIAATLVLVAGVIDDVRSRQFHPWLFAGTSIFALLVALVLGGLTALPSAAMGFVSGFAILMPLVMLNFIGGGDMKLMAAFGILAGWGNVLSVSVYALFWGAAFGVLRAIINGQGKILVHNVVAIVTTRERTQLQLQQMPYTIAILMAWLTVLASRGWA